MAAGMTRATAWQRVPAGDDADAVAERAALGTSARVVVRPPENLEAACAAVDGVLAVLDRQASGLAMLAGFSAAVVAGVAARLGPGGRLRLAAGELHRTLALFCVAFLGLHVVTAILDPYVKIGWASTVLPLASPYRTLAIGLGALAVDQVDGRGGCGHPDGAVRLVRTALRTFGAELERHAAGRCSGGPADVLPVPSGSRR